MLINYVSRLFLLMSYIAVASFCHSLKAACEPIRHTGCFDLSSLADSTDPHVFLPKLVKKYLTSDAIDQHWPFIEYAILELHSPKTYQLIKMIYHAHVAPVPCPGRPVYTEKESNVFKILTIAAERKEDIAAKFRPLQVAIYEFLHEPITLEKKEQLFDTILKKFKTCYEIDRKWASKNLQLLLDNGKKLELYQYCVLLELAIEKDRRIFKRHALKCPLLLA